jgi:valyl-tRNA synthetase
MQRLVTEIRRFRAEQGLKPGQTVAGRIAGLDRTGLDRTAGLVAHEGEVRALARLDAVGADFAASATLRVGEVTVELDLRGAIDVGAERKRLEKDLAAAQKDRRQAQAKLGNEQFLAKAPDEVVAKVRERLVVAEDEVARLETALGGLPVG